MRRRRPGRATHGDLRVARRCSATRSGLAWETSPWGKALRTTASDELVQRLECKILERPTRVSPGPPDV